MSGRKRGPGRGKISGLRDEGEGQLLTTGVKTVQPNFRQTSRSSSISHPIYLLVLYEGSDWGELLYRREGKGRGEENVNDMKEKERRGKERENIYLSTTYARTVGGLPPLWGPTHTSPIIAYM